MAEVVCTWDTVCVPPPIYTSPEFRSEFICTHSWAECVGLFHCPGQSSLRHEGVVPLCKWHHLMHKSHILCMFSLHWECLEQSTGHHNGHWILVKHLKFSAKEFSPNSAIRLIEREIHPLTLCSVLRWTLFYCNTCWFVIIYKLINKFNTTFIIINLKNLCW